MLNIVIALEDRNLNPVVESFGFDTRSLILHHESPDDGAARLLHAICTSHAALLPDADILFAVSRSSETKLFHITEISYIESFGNMKSISGTGGTFEFYGTLRKIEAQICRFGFLRISNSYIISLKHIKSATARSVVMDNDKAINVGRKYYTAFKRAMGEMSPVRLN